MSEKRTFWLRHAQARKAAEDFAQKAPEGWCVTFQEPTRSLEQNARFHAICRDLAISGFKWAGKPRTQAQWKVLLVSGHAVATNSPVDIVPGLEGEFINIRESTAMMSKGRSSSLIEYAQAFCALHGVRLEANAAAVA